MIARLFLRAADACQTVAWVLHQLADVIHPLDGEEVSP